jgi:hypothetical protein
MKKIICSLIMAVLMTLMLVTAANAAGTSIVVSDVNAKPGDEITVAVNIVGNTGFGAATFDIVYDSDALTLTAMSREGTLFGKGMGVENVAKNRINCASATAITGDGVLFNLTFKVADNAPSGEYNVSISISNFTDTNGTHLEPTIVAGTVTVHKCVGTFVKAEEPTCTEDGNIAYYVCDCGKLYADEACTKEITKEDTIIASPGHSWEWVTDEEATCGKAGSKHEECECGAKRSENTEIPATEKHDWKWVIDEEATCGKAGSKHEECECGAKRNENTEIPATGEHDFSNGDCACGAKNPAVVPPTGDTVGNGVAIVLVVLVATLATGFVVYTKKREN